MKTRVCISLLSLGVVIWFGACASMSNNNSGDTTKNVVFFDAGVVLPGTKISDADYGTMNRILSQYSKSLYVVKTYENGKLTKTQGKMKNVVLDKKLTAEIAANIKKPGFTKVVGIITNPLVSSNSEFPKRPELTNRLKALLEKYRRN